MCYIAVIKTLEPNTPTLNLIKTRLYQQMATNSDGFYVNNDGKSLRTLDISDAVKFIDEAGFENTGLVHFRQATTGTVDKNNVHGWHNHGWEFTHNGTVSKFSDSYNAKTKYHKADSLMFFNQLVNKFRVHHSDVQLAKIIQNHVNATRFWGRATLHNVNNDKMFLFGSWHTYIVNKSYVVISSVAIDFKQVVVERDIHGLNFTETENFTWPVVEDTTDEIAVIHNFSTPDWKYYRLSDFNDGYEASSIFGRGDYGGFANARTYHGNKDK